MPVPWEALISFGMRLFMKYPSVCVSDGILQPTPGLVTVMFGAVGTLLNVSTRAQNQGKARIFLPTPSTSWSTLSCSLEGTM